MTDFDSQFRRLAGRRTLDPDGPGGMTGAIRRAAGRGVTAPAEGAVPAHTSFDGGARERIPRSPAPDQLIRAEFARQRDLKPHLRSQGFYG